MNWGRLHYLLAGAVLASACTLASGSDLSFRSAHAVVMDEETGQVLAAKNFDEAAPIASLTKLMTAMVVLDANPDMSESLRIEQDDVDQLKHTHSRLPVGTSFERGTLLELALLSSDNRAAFALARAYPGGIGAFKAATDTKIEALGLKNTVLVEPTGLSADNRASAADMALVLRAAGTYPEIARITSSTGQRVRVGAREMEFRNTNALVGKPGWNILLSKTGFTNEAGRCLTMRLESAGRKVLVVLMGAAGTAQRTRDAINVRRWLGGDEPVYAEATERASGNGRIGKSKVAKSRQQRHALKVAVAGL